MQALSTLDTARASYALNIRPLAFAHALNIRSLPIALQWSGGCLDWWLNNMTSMLPIIVAGMADSGSLLCLVRGLMHFYCYTPFS